ncbi:MAG: TatD family hydrolase [Flavobacteriales bacterium]
MNFIDTHAHLYSSQFKDDQDEMIKRAFEAKVNQIYLPSIDSSYYQSMLELEQKYPKNIQLMMGLHPCNVKQQTYKEELRFVEEQLSKRPFSAVGEIGIDLYWDSSTLEVQKEVFYQQIYRAKELDLAVNIHCREAFEETLMILEELKDEKLSGIFHCFSGTKEHAERAIACGMKLGIGGVVTFKNGKIDRFLHEIDLKHIVLETDAPYLAPTPFRGKRNESAYIVTIAEKLASIYQRGLDEIAEITTQNALEIYKDYQL